MRGEQVAGLGVERLPAVPRAQQHAEQGVVTPPRARVARAVGLRAAYVPQHQRQQPQRRLVVAQLCKGLMCRISTIITSCLHVSNLLIQDIRSENTACHVSLGAIAVW